MSLVGSKGLFGRAEQGPELHKVSEEGEGTTSKLQVVPEAVAIDGVQQAALQPTAITGHNEFALRSARVTDVWLTQLR